MIAGLEELERLDEQSSGSSSQVVQRDTSRDLRSGGGGEFEALFDSASGLLREACRGRLLLVLDTFEEVQRQQLSNIRILWDFVARLRERVDVTRTIVSGRALDVMAVHVDGHVNFSLEQIRARRIIAQCFATDASIMVARRRVKRESQDQRIPFPTGL